MEITKVKAIRREETGTRSSRILRKRGFIPAVIYGHGEPVELVSLDHRDLTLAISHGARTLEIGLGVKPNDYFIKDVQYDHLGIEPIHLDLTRVSQDERVKVRIGVELRGVPKGLSEGGVLDQHMADVEVECRVTDIPDTLHPLVTELNLGESLLVKDLQLPDGVVALAGPDDHVATVRALAVSEEESVGDEVDPTESSSAEPERIGRIRKDEETDKA